jgi:hypothetical protein
MKKNQRAIKTKSTRRREKNLVNFYIKSLLICKSFWKSSINPSGDQKEINLFSISSLSIFSKIVSLRILTKIMRKDLNL